MENLGSIMQKEVTNTIGRAVIKVWDKLEKCSVLLMQDLIEGHDFMLEMYSHIVILKCIYKPNTVT